MREMRDLCAKIVCVLVSRICGLLISEESYLLVSSEFCKIERIQENMNSTVDVYEVLRSKKNHKYLIFILSFWVAIYMDDELKKVCKWRRRTF